MARNDPKDIDIEIDGETYPVDGREHTVRELLVLSGSDPDTTYLIELRGDEEIKHENVDEVLKIHRHMRFVTGDRGPAPVA
jgi:biopolymer transport protein ExbD